MKYDQLRTFWVALHWNRRKSIEVMSVFVKRTKSVFFLFFMEMINVIRWNVENHKLWCAQKWVTSDVFRRLWISSVSRIKNNNSLPPWIHSKILGIFFPWFSFVDECARHVHRFHLQDSPEKNPNANVKNEFLKTCLHLFPK